MENSLVSENKTTAKKSQVQQQETNQSDFLNSGIKLKNEEEDFGFINKNKHQQQQQDQIQNDSTNINLNFNNKTSLTNKQKQQIIKKMAQNPIIFFQNIIFANYNNLDQIINHEKNRKNRCYPKYSLDRKGHLQVMMLSLYMYAACFIVINYYITQLYSSYGILAAIVSVILTSFTTIYYNSRLIKHLVMPYFFSNKSSSNYQSAHQSQLDINPRKQIIYLENDQSNIDQTNNKNQSVLDWDDDNNNNNINNDKNQNNDSLDIDLENHVVIVEKPTIIKLKTNKFTSTFEIDYFFVQNYKANEEIEEDQEQMVKIYFKQDQMVFQDLQIFLIVLSFLLTIFYLYLIFIQSDQLLYVLIFMGFLFILENFIIKPIVCYILSYIQYKAIQSQINLKDHLDNYEFIVESIKQQEIFNKVYNNMLDQMNKEILLKQLKENKNKILKENLFVIDEQEEHSQKLNTQNNLEQCFDEEEEKRRQEQLRIDELIRQQKLKDQNLFDNDDDSQKNYKSEYQLKVYEDDINRPITSDYSKRIQEKHKKDMLDLSRELDNNDSDIDNLAILEENNRILQEQIAAKNLRDRLELEEKLRQQELLRQQKLEFENDRKLNFLRQQELFRQKELKRIEDLQKNEELRRLMNAKEWEEYMKKLEYEKQQLFAKRKTLTEQRQEKLNKQRQLDLEKQLKKQEQEQQKLQQQSNNKNKQDDEGTIFKLNFMLNNDQSFNKSFSYLNFTGVIKNENDKIKDDDNFNDGLPTRKITKEMQIAGENILKNKRKQDQQLTKEEQNNLLMAELGITQKQNLDNCIAVNIKEDAKMYTNTQFSNNKILKKNNSIAINNANNISILEQSINGDLNESVSKQDISRIKIKKKDIKKDDLVILDEPFMLGAQKFQKKLGSYQQKQLLESSILASNTKQQSALKKIKAAKFFNLRQESNSILKNNELSYINDFQQNDFQ